MKRSQKLVVTQTKGTVLTQSVLGVPPVTILSLPGHHIPMESSLWKKLESQIRLTHL